jgi:5-methylcytosine-specific restriction endonuclease McrA
MDRTLWHQARKAALQRDGSCTVALLLGGECHGRLDVHHIVPRSAGGTDELDNLLVVCAAHHPQVEALRRALLDRQAPRCPHRHTTRLGRALCEARELVPA